jgi:hypothetical protein
MLPTHALYLFVAGPQRAVFLPRYFPFAELRYADVVLGLLALVLTQCYNIAPSSLLASLSKEFKFFREEANGSPPLRFDVFHVVVYITSSFIPTDYILCALQTSKRDEYSKLIESYAHPCQAHAESHGVT